MFGDAAIDAAAADENDEVVVVGLVVCSNKKSLNRKTKRKFFNFLFETKPTSDQKFEFWKIVH